MSAFSDRLTRVTDWWDRLSQRERTMLTALAGTAILLTTLVVGFLITDGLSTFQERNSQMREALRDIDIHRESYLKAKAKARQLETRLPQQPLQLGGYLEAAAKESGVTIPEQNERPLTPAGKQYMERAIDLRLKQVTLPALADFLKRIENGPNLVAVTALNVRTRDDKREELDVEMTVSTYERNSEKNKLNGKKGDKQ